LVDVAVNGLELDFVNDKDVVHPNAHFSHFFLQLSFHGPKNQLRSTIIISMFDSADGKIGKDRIQVLRYQKASQIGLAFWNFDPFGSFCLSGERDHFFLVNDQLQIVFGCKIKQDDFTLFHVKIATQNYGVIEKADLFFLCEFGMDRFYGGIDFIDLGNQLFQTCANSGFFAQHIHANKPDQTQTNQKKSHE